MNDVQQAAEQLKRAKAAMYANQFAQACIELEPLLDNPEYAQEALYMHAVCGRYQNKFDVAQSSLDKLLGIAPEFGRAHQEAGYLALVQGQKEIALKQFIAACRFNPALTASWEKQASLLHEAGQQEQAISAQAQADRLKSLSKPLYAATNFLAEGKLLKAEDLCRIHLKSNPKDVEAMRLLADIGSRLGVLEDAEILLEKAVEFEPDNIQLRLDYIQILRKRQKFSRALEEAKRLYDLDPENAIFQSHYAIEKMQTGDYEGAVELMDAVLETLPHDPATLTSRGHALKTWGKQKEAIASYNAACRARPEQGDAWYALANLKTYSFSNTEMQQMLELEQRADLSYADRVHFCFALGSAFEKAGDIEKSFQYFEKGNTLKRTQSRYTSEGMEAELALQKQFCTSDVFKVSEGGGFEAADPVFIVGLPRAGSTLIEQILASHSQVDGTLELPNILALSQRLRGRNRSNGGAYPENLTSLSADQLKAMGQEYIETTRIHRKGAPYFTDKMPNNFRHIGLIHLILPNAKIIDARREPMSCCFSGFKQLFAEGQEFTYGLEEMGRYYRAYVDLMKHWDDVLPGKVLRVQHEDVVNDLEAQVSRILDYCNLPFEQACVDFHKTDRPVRTASSEQVRQPINTKGLDAWLKFEPYLTPLKMALGPNFVG